MSATQVCPSHVSEVDCCTVGLLRVVPVTSLGAVTIVVTVTTVTTVNFLNFHLGWAPSDWLFGRSRPRWVACAPQISPAQPWQSLARFATLSSCAVACVYPDKFGSASVICLNHVPKLRTSKQLCCKDASSMTSSQPLSDPSLLKPL